jgi:hypothetical protein
MDPEESVVRILTPVYQIDPDFDLFDEPSEPVDPELESLFDD